MKKTFRIYIFGALIVLAIILIFIANVGFHIYSQQHIKDGKLKEFDTYINLFRFSLERTISESFNNLEMKSDHIKFKDYAGKNESFLWQGSSIQYVLILDKDGLIRDIFPRRDDLINIDLSFSALFRNAINYPFFGPYFSVIDKRPYYVISKSMSDKIVLAFLQIPEINSLLEILKKQGMYAFIVNKKGMVLFHIDERVVNEGTNWSDLEFVKKGIAGEGGLLDVVIDGKSYMFKASEIPYLNGVIFIGVPISEAFSVLYSLREKMIYILFISIVVAFLISLVFAGGLLRPIKEILKMIEKIKEGQYKITPYKSGLEELDIVSNNLSQMAQSIYDRELKLQKVFDASQDGLILSTVEGDILDINEAGIKMFGFESKEEVLKIKAMQTYQDISKRIELLKELETKGYIKDFEVTFKRKDNTTFYGLISSSLVRDENGEILFIVSTIKDITEKGRLMEQLFQAQKMESIGRLTGSIAHDFNNILSIISGSNQLIQIASTDNPKIQKYTESIAKGVERAKDFIQKLLIFSKSHQMEFRVYDINELLREELKLLRSTIREDITLGFEPFDMPLPVKIDRSQFTQIILNLIVNAVEAMPKGGSITIGVSSRRFDAKTIRHHPFAKEGDYACITFTDTGKGIPSDIIDEIFEPFFTTKSQGTGLGLSTVYGIVNQHQGFINVYSEEGQGTTFKIYLPLSEKEEKMSQEQELIVHFKKIRNVVLVDDKQDVREVIEEMLKSIGLNVISFSSGLDLLEKFNEIKEEIDLCLFDVIMPLIGGFELYNKLKEIKPDIKVLFMTGYANNIAQISALSKEGMKIINKPFTISELKMKISEFE